MKTLRIILALSTGLVLGSTSAALAQGAPVPQAWVSAADLDLGREAGAREFLKRVSRAAGRICGGPDIRAHQQRAFKQCRDETIADAVGSVSSPMLTAVHRNDQRAIVLARR